jgi:hypothetical protein
MPLGNTEPFLLQVKKQNKSNAAQILLGKIAVRDTAITPDGWKQCNAATSNGPFCVAVNSLYATTDTFFSAAFAPSEVIVKAGGTIDPGAYVKTDANGDVVAAVVGTDTEVQIVGRYIAKEGEIDASTASANDNIRVRLGLT